MIGKRLKKANQIAKKRFKREIWNVPEPGCLRKNNTVCSCEMCCNPRRCGWSGNKAKLTIQERKAPTILEFEEEEYESMFWDYRFNWGFDDHEKWYFMDCWDEWLEEEYKKDLENLMLVEFLREE